MPDTSTLRILAGTLIAGVAAIGFAAAAGAFTPATAAAPAVLPVQVPLGAAAPPAPAPVQPAPALNGAAPALQPVPPLAPVPALPAAVSTAVSTALPTSAQLAAAGITDPIKIERDDGRIEVEHRDAAGRRFETYFDARTGAVIKHEQERRDDDRRGGYADD